jgi:hypothetical protein
MNVGMYEAYQTVPVSASEPLHRHLFHSITLSPPAILQNSAYKKRGPLTIYNITPKRNTIQNIKKLHVNEPIL